VLKPTVLQVSIPNLRYTEQEAEWMASPPVGHMLPYWRH